MSLGLLLGTCANHGLDKLTLIVSPRIYDLGAWLEQLIAESTGKNGRALIPVDREAVAAPNVYSHDRVFAYVRLASAPDDAQDAAVEALVAAGRPVVRLDVAEPYGLAGEFFRWEIATAVAGSVMGINPFDQPDVEASKIATRKLTSEFEATGALSPESPVLADDGMTFFTDNVNADALRRGAGEATARAWLKAHLDRLGAGDYFALLAYIAMSKVHDARLQSIRMRVRDRRGVATCLGFGPRFLHSTGQAYKGGPNSGVFLQMTSDDAVDLPVPGARYSFGVVKAAQARGDFQVLVERGRRALRVHLGADVEAGLNRLEQLVDRNGLARLSVGCECPPSGGLHEVRLKPDATSLPMRNHNATRNGRSRPHGLEHGAAPDEGRPRMCGHRPQRRCRCRLARDGATGAHSLKDLVAALRPPRAVWVMVPAGNATEQTVTTLGDLLQAGDTIIDGGNSWFKDDVRRAKLLASQEGELRRCRHQRRRLGRRARLLPDGGRAGRGRPAPRSDLQDAGARRGWHSAVAWPRRQDRARRTCGYLHCGPSGAGHFVKMIHNGIEYGLMQAFAEGFDIMRHAGDESLPADQRYQLDLADIAELWRRGSVVSSWLLDLTAIALAEDPRLDGFTGFVQDSGEGRWTLLAAIEEAVPAEVLSASLYARFRSRQDHTFAEKLLSAMRKQFGGHVEPCRRRLTGRRKRRRTGGSRCQSVQAIDRASSFPVAARRSRGSTSSRSAYPDGAPVAGSHGPTRYTADSTRPSLSADGSSATSRPSRSSCR